MQPISLVEEVVFHPANIDTSTTEESTQPTELQQLTGVIPPRGTAERQMDVEVSRAQSKKKSGFSPLEICLFILAVMLAAIAIAMIIAYATYDDGICKTPACVNAASRIMTNMDPTVDPCANFYQYACGGWLKKNIMPETASRYSTIDIVKDRLTATLKDSLGRQNDSDITAVKKVKTFYRSCLDDDTKNRRKGQPLIRTLPDIFEWPVAVDNWDGTYGSTWSAEKSISHLNAKYGVYQLIKVYVAGDDRDSSSRIVHIDQPDLALPSRDYYACTGVYEQICTAYVESMVSLAVLIRKERNLTVNEGQIRDEMKQVLELEKEIANASIPDDIRSDPNNIYHKMQLSQVATEYPVVMNGQNLNWLSFINQVLEPGGITIQASENVIMYASEYIKAFAALVPKYKARVLQNHLALKYIRNVVGGLSREYKDAVKPLNEALYGQTTEGPLWQTCVDFMSNSFDDVVGRLYVEASFSGGSKDVVKKMTAEIRKSFLQMLEDQKWMDETTKKKAELKALKIEEKIGYSDDTFNDSKLNKDFAQLDFKEDEYFENKLKMYAYGQVIKAQKLRERVDTNVWMNGAAEINAFYATSNNQIVLPAGILQPPFFSALEPAALHYGGIGTVIGHELTHGFDNNGKNYDEKGDLVNWWTDESLKKFNDLSQCFVYQYGNYSWSLAGGKNLSGTVTLGENIADDGGIREAYKAYQDYLKTNGREKKLPGLDLTNEQLFFVGFGQIWCSTYTTEYAITSITSDEHSPGEFRVIGSLQNSNDFSKAYSCPSKTYMNPTHKCNLW
ncbi:neprilysin isoform X2 [Ascaphus truei]|uniref:neprilysin isoform X2 n=1 Tax=Ascaphus truei TaxID=8439 RepID=UPI003F5966EF